MNLSGSSGLTVLEARRDGRRQLETASDTPQLDADLLLGHALGWDRNALFRRLEQDLSIESVETYRKLLNRRRAGQPVAYLTGVKEWFGLELRVSPSVMVPRPETELLSEQAIRIGRSGNPGSIVDVGTGSGAIAIALALGLADANITGLDISSEALNVARVNVTKFGLEDRVELGCGDLLEPLVQEPDMVVANLPYVPVGDAPSLRPDVLAEPPLALFGGETGLDVVERLLRQIATRSWEPDLLLEIDPRQAGLVNEMAHALRPQSSVTIFQDLAGRDRVVHVPRKVRKVPSRRSGSKLRPLSSTY